jgi:hypothetical protein
MDWPALDELSKQQLGVLGMEDAGRLGMSRKALRDFARRHGWERPCPGVIIVPGSPESFEQRCKIATVAAGRRALVSREAAAYLHGMTRDEPDNIELVVPADRRLALSGLDVAVWRSSTLLQSDVAQHLSIPLTCPARTVIDLAAVLSLDQLRGVVIDGRQRRIVTLEQIGRRHQRIASYPGRANVTRVLRDLDEETCDSMLEWDFRTEARRRGFRPFPRPFPFRCSDGVVIEIDVAFPREWVACECDGFGSHSERTSLTRHHKRQNRAVADGWRPFLVDWTRLKRDPDGLFADLAALLAGADPDRPPAPLAC